MACVGAICTPGTPPLERAQACIDMCKLFNPEYFRSTLLAQSYRDCLEACTYQQTTEGLESPNWPAELVATVGQDLQTLQREVKIDLALVAVIALAVAVIVFRVT